MADTIELRPGESAPAAGPYEELNIFGSLTGRVHMAEKGEPLPQAPLGFAWRKARSGDGAEPFTLIG